MNFDPTIPRPDVNVSATQSPLLVNNQTVKQSFDINHSAMNTSRQGKHNLVIFRQQASDPAAGEIESSGYIKSRYGTPQFKIIKGTKAAGVFSSFFTPFPSIKAWVKWEGRLNDGACTIIRGYNVTSVDQITVGPSDVRYRIVITNALGFTTDRAFYRADGITFAAVAKSCIRAVAAGQFDIQFTANVVQFGNFFLWGDA